MEAIRHLRRAIHNPRRIRSVPQRDGLSDGGRQRIGPRANRGGRGDGAILAAPGGRVPVVVRPLAQQPDSGVQRLRYDHTRFPGFACRTATVQHAAVDAVHRRCQLGQIDHERNPADRQQLERKRLAHLAAGRSRVQVRRPVAHPAVERRAGGQFVRQLYVQPGIHLHQSVPEQLEQRQSGGVVPAGPSGFGEPGARPAPGFGAAICRGVHPGRLEGLAETDPELRLPLRYRAGAARALQSADLFQFRSHRAADAAGRFEQRGRAPVYRRLYPRAGKHLLARVRAALRLRLSIGE